MATDTATDTADTRGDYAHFQAIQTRWSDNDLYGHVNNVTYYSYFDTVVNRYLIDAGGFDIQNDQVIGVAVETHCSFSAPVAFPDALEAGLRVGHLGNSSVRYEIAIFPEGADIAVATGYFVHVFVDRADNRSVAIPAPIRAALEKILAGGPGAGPDE